MRFIFLALMFLTFQSCQGQVYDIHFVNSDEDIVISFSKKLISDTKKCFKLTNEEQEKVKKFNLNQGAIKVMLNKIEVAKYSIIDISTSKTYKGKIYLCTVDGSVKFDENICLD